MSSEFIKVSYRDIEQLNDLQLTNILQTLLTLEAQASGIPLSGIDVPLKITVSDAGEDGKIHWEGGVEKTNWLPNRLTLIQCKATDMSPAACAQEIVVNETNALKPKVEEVLEAGGSYILFYGRNCNGIMETRRIDSMRSAISNAGKSYSDTADILIYDANKIANWVNQYVSAAISVWSTLGKAIPHGFRTWDKWRGYQDNRYNYVFDEKIAGYIDLLRKHFDQPQKIARVVGLSGLGKTRLAFEAFRPPEDPQNVAQQNLSNQVVYVDAASSPAGLPGVVSSLVDAKVKGLLVVDNCDLSLHKKLKQEIQHADSLLSLLSLDYNPEQVSSGDPFIIIERNSDQVIKGILQQAYPGLPERDIERISDFAQGFPQMAVLLAEARLSLAEQIGSLQDDELMNRLLWGRDSEDPIAYKVISSCALFDHLGFTEDLSPQRMFAAEKICGIDGDLFYEKAQYFVRRGILDVRGRYVRVTPRPLAIRLAADWWAKCSPEKATGIMSSDFPVGMSGALCEQMSKLHFLPEAQRITAELCGPQAPFGRAEVLLSDEGSLIFRSLVEVNPQATTQALLRIFGEMNHEDLLGVEGDVRRNLVWTLEKLCFWEDTFTDAASLLFSFAAAENESWGNNATAQFKQLFHYVLSGTQADLSARIELIEREMVTESIHKKLLCVDALGSALSSGPFSRMSGVETQGSRPAAEEFRPKTWEDIFSYWKKCLDLLTHFAVNEIELREKALDAISSNIRGLLRHGRLEEVEVSLRTITRQIGPYWPNAQEAIQDTLRYEDKMPKEANNRIETWLEWLRPVDLREKLKLIVCVPPWNHHKTEEGKYIDVADIDAVNLALEQSTNIDAIVENLDVLIKGEQRRGVIFGRTLCENLTQADQRHFISEICKALATISDGNPTLLIGVLSAESVERSVVVDTLQHLVTLKQFDVLLRVTSSITPLKEDLALLLDFLKDGALSISDFRIFKYGRALEHLEPNSVKWFIEQLCAYNVGGVAVALDILFMHTYGDKDAQFRWLPVFRKLITVHGLLQHELVDTHVWGEVVVLTLEKSETDDGLIKFLTDEIIKSCAARDSFIDHKLSINNVMIILLRDYYSLSWPIFSENLGKKGKELQDWRFSYNLSNIFEIEVALNEDSSSLLSLVPQDFLVRWCNSMDRALILSEVLPVYLKVGGQIDFSPVAKFLIDKYGFNEKVLVNIYRNMTPNSWWGSIVPYYEQAIRVLVHLKEHDSRQVRAWVKNVIDHLNKSISREKQREAEDDFIN